uniref:Sacsin/Nov domain-containing protein n=1 Tax=Callorhinchus milii TaxID=7868 RepID=A0A4W3HU50_CALMI
MLWVLRNSEILFRNREVLEGCRDLAFLASGDRMVRASDLFDPREPTFQQLFQPESSHLFPPAVYTDPGVLDSLQRLGLRTSLDKVGPDHLLKTNILKEYDQRHDLFKELVQNAEDAGAGVCRFLVDMRQNSTPPESLIDPGMASCHGPALWSYNDELFTPEDFVNIVRVGAASKEKRTEKIGKFGLGFNSVYHVTDVPAILSGQCVLIFDPNVTHLSKVIKSPANPGIKLNLGVYGRLLRMYPGQFEPYQGIFGCNMSPGPGKSFHYQGTLIKLPFRTEREARSSEMCSTVYGWREISALTENFREGAVDLLVFLRSIKEVSLQHLPEAGSPSDQESVSTQIRIRKEDLEILEVEVDFPTRRIQEQSVGAEHWAIADFRESRIVQIEEETELGERNRLSCWLVHSCFGTGRALEISRAGTGNFVLPLGSVAVPLSKSASHWQPGLSALAGRVFCFLPLPIHSQLPVQINGTFAVSSNRKDLWSTGPKGEWNQALLQDPVASAYITALWQLKAMSERGQLKQYHYYTFWPDVKAVSSRFSAVARALYRLFADGIDGCPVNLFSDGTRWCSMQKAYFLESAVMDHPTLGASAFQALSGHLAKVWPTDHPLGVSLPDWVRESFAVCGLGALVNQNTYDWERLYGEVLLPELQGVPCVPTHEGGGHLQYINKLVHPDGKLACLYYQVEGRFPQGTSQDFLHSRRLARLETLGMQKDRTTTQELMERAGTIPEL